MGQGIIDYLGGLVLCFIFDISMFLFELEKNILSSKTR